MNPLQTGTPSSSLAPQGYRNSTQSGTVQGTLNRSNVQQSNDDLLQAPVSGKLKVVTGGGNAVLGASTVADSTPVNIQKAQSSGVPMSAVLLLIVSVVGAVYFFRRYLSLPSFNLAESDEE